MLKSKVGIRYFKMYKYIGTVEYRNDEITSIAKGCVDRRELIQQKSYHLRTTDSIKKHSEGTATLTNEVDTEIAIEIRRRFDWVRKTYGKRLEVFNQYDIPEDKDAKIHSLLPKEIEELNPQVTIQICLGGDAIAPHKDHRKSCSMFYLYTSPDVETRWWEKTQDFIEYEHLRYADPEKIEVVHTEIIQPGKWYIFDNDVYHSFHRLPDTEIKRVTLLLEFCGVSAHDLFEIVNGL